jgi:hypothetical protein
MWRSWHLRSKLNAIVCTMIVTAAVSASAMEGETTFGGKALYGYLVSGLEANSRAARLPASRAKNARWRRAMTGWARSWLR